MNVLITGGTGFIGSRVAIKCLERGDSVKVLALVNNDWEAQNREAIEAKGVEVAVASVSDRERVFELLEGIDLVYHLAAAQHEANVPDQRFWDVNVGGTRNVLEGSVAAGVKRFVHGSTIGVYGSAAEGTLDENSPLRPDNIYGRTKLEGEKLALSFGDRLPVAVIRIPETYGPGDQRLLRLFKTIKNSTFFMIGKGRNLHHPIYVSDLTEGLLLAAARDEAVGKILLLAGKEPVTTNEMVQVIAEQLGTRIRKVRAPLLPFLVLATVVGKTLGSIGIQPPIHPRRMDFFRKSFVFSGERAQRALGFAPRYGFREGVQETAAWYSERGYL